MKTLKKQQKLICCCLKSQYPCYVELFVMPHCVVREAEVRRGSRNPRFTRRNDGERTIMDGDDIVLYDIVFMIRQRGVARVTSRRRSAGAESRTMKYLPELMLPHTVH